MILSCSSVSKSFGDHEVLRGVSFSLEAKDRAALVGPNGAGKSTLMKIIMGEMSSDSGQIDIPKDITVGYLAQQEILSGSDSVIDTVRASRQDLIDTEQKLRQLEQSMKWLQGEELEAAMDRYHRLTDYYERSNGYALESELQGVLRGLGFTPEEYGRPVDVLSGGQRTRAALACLLMRSPDLLLLDEPTNHLDLHAIEWLENYLAGYQGALLVVSHDRYFLNRVAGRIISIEGGQSVCIRGNYDQYARVRAERREADLKEWMRTQQEIAHEQEVIRKLRSFNREKSIRRAESREKKLARMDAGERPQTQDQKMRLVLKPLRESGRDILKIDHVSMAFGAHELFRDADLMIRRGERVALVGDNGTGKSTLLKMICGQLEPVSGTLIPGPTVQIGYYDQELAGLHADKTIFDEISDRHPDLDQTRIRSTLAAFLFTGDDVFKTIGSLSGGEQGRVSLALLMLSGANFLLLDEPTNHLDMDSREILEQALVSYTGTLLYVSHDRYFIRQTATRIWELNEKQIRDYPMGYEQYRSALEEQRQAGAGETAAAAETDARRQWLSDKQQRAQQARRRSELSRIEEQIAQLEEEIRTIDARFELEEVCTDPEKLASLAARRQEADGQLQDLYDRWAELEEETT